MLKKDLINLWVSYGLSQNQIEEIISKITGLSISQLFLEDYIQESFVEWIKDLFIRFESFEPFEYLINKANFYWNDFYVDSRVLIPRNDTEVMISEVVNHIKNTNNNYVIIDIWTWSGCIPISIYTILNNLNILGKISNIFAIDLSTFALEVAKINIINYLLLNNIVLLKSDLLWYFLQNKEEFKTKNVIITANLPYIKDMDTDNMELWVINYEPEIALYWWSETWFEMYERLFGECILFKDKYFLNELILFIEIWFDQEEYAKKYLDNKWFKYELFKDNSWIFRCIKINVL